MPLEDFDPSAIAAVQDLRARFPDTPFLTLGQTVLWDEPVKAAFCRILEAVAPDATMVAAVHDTDYFAKLGHIESDEKFALLPHNDGTTRGLWSAAGEISCLFGAETVPTRAILAENGVAFDRVAKLYPGGANALLNQETEAWGWRALVHTEPHALIAADVKLRDIAPTLRAQLQWAVGESLNILGENAQGENAARDVADKIAGWIDEYIEFDEDGTLSDLYRALTPKLWAMVRGGGACNLQTGTSTEIFRFNRQTHVLPRFHFLELFLDPSTRETARRCYDDAVRGSGIYTLNQFGDGAVPFDVVIRGRGRGTLRLFEGSLFIETEEPITLCAGCDCSSLAELADVLEAKFGSDVAIVGKAVALISMLAAEFLFVFHEKASGYTARTAMMNKCLRDAGISLKLHPMLRLEYQTWNALANVSAEFHLPPHLATAFGVQSISARDFAANWQAACENSDATRAALKACHAPRDLMGYLAHSDAARWQKALQELDTAKQVIQKVRLNSGVLLEQIETLRGAAREATQNAAQVERAKGDDWRQSVQPLRQRLFDLKENGAARLNATTNLTKEERAARANLEAEEEREIERLRAEIAQRIGERAHFDIAIEAQRSQARDAKSQALALTKQRVAFERSDEAISAREAIARLQYDAELERLQRTRDALLAGQSLRLTNLRPTAWWFPLVSPDGTWFRKLAQTAQARVEEL